jgi:hypothetical protein
VCEDDLDLDDLLGVDASAATGLGPLSTVNFGGRELAGDDDDGLLDALLAAPVGLPSGTDQGGSHLDFL